MRKFYTLILGLLLAFSSTELNAQLCDASFTSTINGNTLSVTPTMAYDSFMTVSHRWYFGDGTPLTSQAYATHTYANCGTYTIFHELLKKDSLGQVVCYDSVMQMIVIQCNTPCNLIAGFRYATVQGAVNTVAFTNTTNFISPSDSVKWSFGDSSFSSDINPTHTYTSPGTYRVCLWVKNNTLASPTPCWSETCQMVVINNATPCNLMPMFNYQVNPQQPNVVSFFNTSIPANAPMVTWQFGDSTTGTGNQISHTYAQGGNYWVCMRLTVSNTCSRDTCFLVAVGNPTITCNMVANFGWNSTGQPGEVAFNSTSTNTLPTDSLFWNFGDGTTAIGNPNPMHSYSAAGNYNVCLRVKRTMPNGTAPCVREVCRTITIAPTNPCNILPRYTVSPVAGMPNTYMYTNTSSPMDSSQIVRWTFGDSTAMVVGNRVTHTFQNPGNYWVCMRVDAGNNCVSDTCGITVVTDTTSNPCNLQTNFTWSLGSPRAVIFQGNVSGLMAGDSVRWNFGDGSYGSALTTIHTYAAPGTYRACLIASRNTAGAPPCISETCRNITIADSSIINTCDSARTSFTYRIDPNQTNKVQFLAVANRTILQTNWTITPMNGSNLPPITLNQYNPTYVFDQSGWYQVCVRTLMPGSCVREFCDSLNIPAVTSVMAYPNPASQQVTVSASLNVPTTIYGFVYNAQNIIVSRQTMTGYTGNNMMSFNIAHLPSGFYTIRLYYGGRSVTTRFQKL
jgi:PKD repeat protein